MKYINVINIFFKRVTAKLILTFLTNLKVNDETNEN